ncbi:MAG: hypothetical protein OXT49_05785 [Gammaproteobacteria bacterium]|nr:hypothetical protein [Gammaproteobacteria bacterium]
MSGKKTEITLLGLTIFTQILIVTLVPGVVAIDVIYLGAAVDESSVTEMVQESLLLVSALIFAWAAIKRPDSRGALILISGLLGCMFIREQDAVFDTIQHGAWVYPAWTLAFTAMFLAYKNKTTITPAVLGFREQTFFAYLSLGLFVVLGFSRIFGTGPLWEAVAPGANDWRVKTAVQEGLELFGYALVFYSALVFAAQRVLFVTDDRDC